MHRCTLACLLDDGSLEQIQSAALAAPQDARRHAHVRSTHGVVASTPLLCSPAPDSPRATADGAAPQPRSPRAPEPPPPIAESQPAAEGPSGSATTSQTGFGPYRSGEADESVSSGGSFLMHDSASSAAWGQPQASDTAGRVLLALAAFQEVVHVMEVGWRVRLGSNAVMWRLKLHCYNASELLKGPGLPGLRGQHPESAWYPHAGSLDPVVDLLLVVYPHARNPENDYKSYCCAAQHGRGWQVSWAMPARAGSWMDRLSGNILGLEFVPRSGPPDSHAVLTILHSTSGAHGGTQSASS